MKNHSKSVIAIATLTALAGIANAQTYTMDFDTDASGNPIASGTTISSEYAAWGVSFSNTGRSGPSGITPGQNWATNTSLRITNTDIGGLGGPQTGNLLHSFNGWLSEDGDPYIVVSFANPIDSISVKFLGVATLNRSGFIAYDASNNPIATSATATGGISTVSMSGVGNISSIIITPGDFNDWVGVDDITFNTVPTPAAAGLLGLATVAAGRRRR
jgi:hypothetical protein